MFILILHTCAGDNSRCRCRCRRRRRCCIRRATDPAICRIVRRSNLPRLRHCSRFHNAPRACERTRAYICVVCAWAASCSAPTTRPALHSSNVPRRCMPVVEVGSHSSAALLVGERGRPAGESGENNKLLVIASERDAERTDCGTNRLRRQQQRSSSRPFTYLCTGRRESDFVGSLSRIYCT